MAGAQSSLVLASDRIRRQEPYRAAGADDCDQCTPEATAKRLLKRLEDLDSQSTSQQQPIGAIALPA
jgi:hypothetical protein